MDRRSFIAAGAALGTAAALPAPLRAAPALDDLTIVRRALLLHPGLYRYQSPREFERRFAAFAREWQEQTGQAERFLALSRLTAAVRCGHTQCNPYNQSKAVVASLFDRPTRLPFTFRWIGGEMVVTGDSGAVTGIAPGSLVERVNGFTPAAMLRTLLPYARADGSNDAKRVAQFEMRGDEAIEAFDIYQGLLFPPGPDGHRVAWRDPAGQRRAATLPAITLATRKALRSGPRSDADLWDWKIGADGIAVLTMPTWVTYRGNWNWQAWLTERFATLQDAKGLVIDLRANEGGTDCGTFILQRLIDRPFRPLRYLNRVSFRETPADLRPALDTWDDSFHTIGRAATPDAAGHLILPGDEDEGVIEPVGPRIPVPVAVLTGPVNSSATFSFARRIKEARAARLIGSTTGGNMRGINGGAYFFVRLPQSGLEFDLPIKGYYPERPQPDAGVTPDIAVRTSAADIAAGYDRLLDTARKALLEV
jgi:hypothetical protein